MKIIAVDDEQLAVDNLTALLRQAEPESEILSFTEAEDAFLYLTQNAVDIAFLDIELGTLSGIELARKCKECLAYLIDRKGARVAYPDLSAVLWEDRPFDRAVQNNTQKVISDMMKTFKEINVEDIITRSRRDIAVDTAQVDCDYFDVLSGNRALLHTFTGEYMSNYSWAEFTAGELEKMKRS